MNIAEFNTGNRKAFEELFHLFFRRLCAFSYKYIHDTDEVEDLVQEAFISLWQKRTDFSDIKAIKSFLYTTVRNKCLNHLKHQLVVKKYESTLIAELENENLFELQVIEEDVFGRLYAEIENLPEGARKIMLLALKGKKNREIAEELQVSENTVKTQKKIAYAKIKDKVDPSLYSFLLAL